MTALTTSPLLIALMQTAASLPVVAFEELHRWGHGLNIIDRRRLLIFWQAWMLVAVLVLSVLTFCGVIGPFWLLGLHLQRAEHRHGDEQLLPGRRSSLN